MRRYRIIRRRREACENHEHNDTRPDLARAKEKEQRRAAHLARRELNMNAEKAGESTRVAMVASAPKAAAPAERPSLDRAAAVKKKKSRKKKKK